LILYYYKFIEIIKKISFFIVGILLILTTLLLFFAVLSRYIFSYSFSWIDAFSRYSMVYIGFIGGAIALNEGLHIGLEYFLNLLPYNIRKLIKKVHFSLILFMGILMYINGLKLISLAYNQTVPAFFPVIVTRGQVYYIFPIAAFLYILIAIGLLLYGDKEKKYF
jgi:C4-dicarboxylate transporter, DctQ subunit